MNDILDAYYELLSKIKKSSLVKDVIVCREKINHNKKLCADIKRYYDIKDPKLRLEILKNEDMMEYKKLENEVNILILRLNKIFKM